MIDSATIERIKNAADIVEVVSEFVTLRKSGMNYKGLCPFHEERTPSFIVSPARGTCHCFGCGKGGNAVGFIMEHEQMTYPEALRWLAKKYHIDIKEREITDEERRQQSERESMFIINEWAQGYFDDTLHNNVDGKAIGMQYFRSRGIRDDIIKKFRLGYDLVDRRALPTAALQKGYKEEFLLKTGICYKTDRGEVIDRYAGRVIFPWIGVSGKVVGFGGRLLDQRTKGVSQKYINSPDSDIFHKDRELYGIFQAKKAIAKEDRVFMVEGYTDVIAMHQCGIENVVANSGTALSSHQIHILHRFTSNITLLYDGDEAGIHAALRGTDMLLSEGMNLKVTLLPDGDDPDSFARKHTAADFRRYIEENQTDFIQFKADLLLKNERDPLKRSEAINSVVRSISLVRDQVLRDTYIHECSTRLGVSEVTLVNTMNNFIRGSRGQQPTQRIGQQTIAPRSGAGEQDSLAWKVTEMERMLARKIVQDGDKLVCVNIETEDGGLTDLNVAQFIGCSLKADGLELKTPVFARILEEAMEHSADKDFNAERFFLSHEDIAISTIAAQLTADKYSMTETETPPDTDLSDKDIAVADNERMEKMRHQTEHLLNDFRLNYIQYNLNEIKKKISQCGEDAARMKELMQEYISMHELRGKLADLQGVTLISHK